MRVKDDPQYASNGEVEYKFPNDSIIRIFNDRCDQYVYLYSPQGKGIDIAAFCQSKAHCFDDYVVTIQSRWNDAIVPWLELGLQLPIQFGWRGWAIGLRVFLSLFFMFPCVAMLFADLDYKVWPVFCGYAFISVVVASEVIPLVRQYFAGPAFILSLEGLFFDGDFFAWHEISSIHHTNNGRGGRVLVVDLNGRKVRQGFFLRENIRLLAFCIKNSRDLADYSQRLLSFSKNAKDFELDSAKLPLRFTQ